MEHLPHSRAESRPVILLGEGLEHQRDTTEFQVLKLETFLGRAGVAASGPFGYEKESCPDK